MTATLDHAPPQALTTASGSHPALRRPPLRTVTGVDRRLAHKQTREDVFITDVLTHVATHHALGELPRQHRFFNDTAGTASHYDALLLTEFARQAVEVIGHALLAVPIGSQFILRSGRVEVCDPDALRISDLPTRILVSVPETFVRRNRLGSAYAISGEVTCSIGGRLVARLEGSVGFLTTEAFTDLRGAARFGIPRGAVTPVPPASVGRQLSENVFIGDPGGSARSARCTVLPRPHPTYFDRPLDHYPGMLLAEAARQLVTAAVAEEARVAADQIRIRSMSMDFTSFAELGTPPALRVTGFTGSGEHRQVQVSCVQAGLQRATFSFSVEVAGPPVRGAAGEARR